MSRKKQRKLKRRKPRNYWRNLEKIELFEDVIYGQWSKKTGAIRIYIFTLNQAEEEFAGSELEASLLNGEGTDVWDNFIAKADSPEDAEELLYYYFLGLLIDEEERERQKKIFEKEPFRKN